MNTELFPATQRAFVSLLAPLRDAASDPLLLADWLSSLGYTASISGNPALTPILARVDAFTTELATAPHDTWEDFAKLLATGRRLTGIIDDIRTFAASLDPRANAGQLAEEILALLLATWLRREHPVLFHGAATLRIIEPRETSAVEPAVIVDGVTTRHRRTIDRLRLDAIGDLLANPGQLLANAYLPNQFATAPDAWSGATLLFAALSLLADRLGIARRVQYRASATPTAPPTDDTLPTPPEEADEPIEADDGTAPTPAEVSPEYFASLFPTFTARLAKSDASDLSLVLKASSAAHAGAIPGYVLSPSGTFQHSRAVNDWTLTISSAGTIPSLTLTSAGVAVAADTPAGATGTARIRIERPAAERAIAGDPDGARLEIGALTIESGVTHAASGTELFVTAGTTKSAIVIAADNSDGFIADLLPANGLRAEFELGLGWSSTRGVHLHGSGGLEADLPIALGLAGLTVSNVHVGLRADDALLSTEISATFSAAIGPVYARIDRVGMQGALTFPATGGNLGSADLSLGFKPPAGVGLSIDAHGVLTGGGFLFHDAARSLYAGAMQLSLQNQLTLSAYGLITTRMPDGRPGYSVLIFITAEGFKPIPLGFGFMLTSIGGMVGIHRTFDQDVLRAGLKNNVLGTLLFPRDPVGNAMNLVQALSSAFPARRGSYLLGLLARITWFTPTLVTLDLALILEFGARSRLLLLGRASALLPSRDNDLIRLNLDSIGVLDFDAGTLEADAVLVDSRLARQFPITGSGALRARWSDAGNFVLAAGGLNPRFAPPAGFPSLERVTVALCSGRNPRLVCESYFALTANTLQFGSRVSLYAEALGFSVAGDLAFDALITILPPHFIVDFHAAVQLQRGSHNLFKVSLDGTLEGPLPLRLAARVRFEILWISFTVPFRFTLAGENVVQAIVPAVRLVDEVRKALADPSSWSTRLPAALTHGVALRSIPLGTAATAPLALDPLGQLVVKQQIAPLNATRDVDTYGGAPIAGDRRFNVTGRLNAQAGTSVNAAFAPTRYFAMSDDDKLAAPSFESMSSGLALGDDTVSYDATTIVPAPLEYEAITLNLLPQGSGVAGFAAASAVSMAAAVEPPTTRYAMPLAALESQSTTGAAALAPVRQAGRARFGNADAAAPATIAPLAWCIVDAQTGALATLDPSIKTWSEYRTALAALNRGGARWQMVPTYELAQQ